MQFVWFSIAFLFVLAGRVLATFNITLGNNVLLPADFLNIPSQSVPSECTGNCATANQTIVGCNNDPNCLCKSDVVGSLQVCQQCMFTQIVTKNQKPLDMRVGSTPLMAGYSTACKTDAQVTLAASQIGLTLPSNWDGPFDVVLPVGGAAVAVIAGGLLGTGALLLLSNMS